jgi:hypothetical protein
VTVAVGLVGANDLDSREGNDRTGKCRAQLDSVDNLGKGGRFVKRSIKECLGDGRSGNLVPIDIRFCNGSRCNQGTLTDSHLSSSRADVTNVGSQDDGRHDGLSLDRISTDLLVENSKDFERTNEKGCSLIGCKNDIESMNENRATRQLNSVPCRASVVAEIHTDNSRCDHVHSDTNDVDDHHDKGQYVSMTKDSRSKLFPVQKSRNNEDREQMVNDHRNKHVSWSRTERSEVDDSNSDIELSEPSTRMHFTAKAASKYKVSAGGYVDGQGSSGRGELGSIGHCTNDRVKLSGSELDNCCRGSRHADCRLSAQSIDNRQKVDGRFSGTKIDDQLDPYDERAATNKNKLDETHEDGLFKQNLKAGSDCYHSKNANERFERVCKIDDHSQMSHGRNVDSRGSNGRVGTGITSHQSNGVSHVPSAMLDKCCRNGRNADGRSRSQEFDSHRRDDGRLYLTEIDNQPFSYHDLRRTDTCSRQRRDRNENSITKEMRSNCDASYISRQFVEPTNRRTDCCVPNLHETNEEDNLYEKSYKNEAPSPAISRSYSSRSFKQNWDPTSENYRRAMKSRHQGNNYVLDCIDERTAVTKHSNEFNRSRQRDSFSGDREYTTRVGRKSTELNRTRERRRRNSRSSSSSPEPQPVIFSAERQKGLKVLRTKVVKELATVTNMLLALN